MANSGQIKRICIIAHQCYDAGGLSVARDMITTIGRTLPECDFFIIVPSEKRFDVICKEIPNCQIFEYTRANWLIRRWIDDTFLIPKLIKAFRPDLVLALGDRGLVSPPCKQVIYFHRPVLVYPAKHYSTETLRNKLLFSYHSMFLKKCLRSTDIIICQTKIIEKRLREKYNYHGDILISTPSITFPKNRSEPSEMPEDLQVYKGKYRLFYPARYHPHKNHQAIVECFSKFRNELKDFVVILTIEKDQHPNVSKLLNQIDKLKLSEQIVNLGRIPNDKIPAYYQHCDALLMPTMLETFGLPYIEAMHLGLPILTSDLDFARYVCGDAAMFFNPSDAKSLMKAILKAQSNPLFTKQLVSKGRDRLGNLEDSWEEVSTQMINKLTTPSSPL